MLSVHTVLKWPYEDLPVMDSSQAFDVGVLPKINFEFLSLKTVDRKPFEAKNIEELSTQVGLYKSTFDRSKGHQSELLLVKKLKEQGLLCYELNHFKDNYIRHIDLEVSTENNDFAFTIDVEAPKALRKSKLGIKDPLSEPQDRFVCLQLGPNSTLFGGSADYLAFGLTSGHFVFAKRNELIKTIKEKMFDFIDGTKAFRSAWPETALWVPYVRTYEGHHTIMTYMDLYDLPLVGFI